MSDNSIMLSGKDMRIIKGMKPTKADKIKEEKMFTNTIKKYLGAEIEIESEDGSKDVMSIAEVMVAKKIAYDIEHPDKIDLKMYSQVLGEDTKTIDVNLKGSKELFGDIVIDQKGDEGHVDYIDSVVDNNDNNFDSNRG